MQSNLTAFIPFCLALDLYFSHKIEVFRVLSGKLLTLKTNAYLSLMCTFGSPELPPSPLSQPQSAPGLRSWLHLASGLGQTPCAGPGRSLPRPDAPREGRAHLSGAGVGRGPAGAAVRAQQLFPGTSRPAGRPAPSGRRALGLTPRAPPPASLPRFPGAVTGRGGGGSWRQRRARPAVPAPGGGSLRPRT